MPHYIGLFAILVCLVSLFLPLFGGETAPSKTPTTETHVYICLGPKAEKYHSHSTCRGLQNCSAEIKRVTQSYAEKKGRKKCKLCYKKQNRRRFSLLPAEKDKGFPLREAFVFVVRTPVRGPLFCDYLPTV